MSEEGLQIADKRREVKGKGEKERYTHLNAEFQRRAKRDKKAFLSDQCKEIEENNLMERLEISSRKLEIPREISTKISTIKDRNGKDLTEAEDIKKRRQEYTEGLYKKSFNDLDNRSHPILNEERWFLCTLFLFISFDSA